MSEAPFEVREYRPGDAVPRDNQGEGKSGAAPYKDLGPAPLGSRCACGQCIGVRRIERRGQVEISCRRCASNATNTAQPASRIGPDSETNPETAPETETKPVTEPQTEPETEPEPDPQTRFAVTFFENYAATTKREEVHTLATLAELIRAATARDKKFLPWLKLARYGERRTGKGSLRHDDNVVAVTGIEADYDGEQMTVDEAVEILEKAGVLAIVYASPSHTANKPRFRVLCPFSVELPPDHRAHMMGRLNGLFRGNFADESWALSQAYYFGSVNENPDHRVEMIDGTPIDELDELDKGWAGKAATASREGGETELNFGLVDQDALAREISSGQNYHRATVRLVGAWAVRGKPLSEAQRDLEALYDRIPEADRDHRWHERRNDIERCLLDIYGKEAAKGDQRGGGEDPSAGELDPKPAAEPKAASKTQLWPEMGADAFHGLAGDVVDAVAPTTEADPVALLAHLLVEFGNAIGRRSYCVADGARHYPNEYAVTVGVTGKGRKGTSAQRIEQFMKTAAPVWYENCLASGLSSGEGIIHAVRDEVRGYEKTGKGKQIEYIEVVKDLGVSDKRLLIHEPEFGGALEVMKRQGSTLSRVIREGWDKGDLRALIKNNAERATGAHISILGHITVDEYRASLDRISMVNGYANRFLNLLVKRAQELPFGKLIDDTIMKPLADRIQRALTNDALGREVTFTDEAAEIWRAGYHDLSAAKPGLYGSVVARSEAHTLRLALIYALLSSSLRIKPDHLSAALAFWRYCDASARFIFGDALGDPIADEILRALRRAGADGMTRWDISNMFGRNLSSDRIGKALLLLEERGKARMATRSSGPGPGRPTEIWKAV